MTTTPRGRWLDVARRVAVLDVARALGLDIGRDGRSFDPCPSCGGKSRASDGESDKRGRCRVYGNGDGWACNTRGSEGCGEKGDGPGLVAWSLCGRPGPRGRDDSATVRAWYVARGWLDEGNAGEGPFPGSVARSALTPAEHPPKGSGVAPVAVRPPFAEVAALWARCVPVTADAAVSAWLRGHHDGPIDPDRVAALDVARALPFDVADLPAWAWGVGGPWHGRGYRVIVRTFEGDGAGGLRWASLHARNVQVEADPKAVKAVNPLGLDAAGAVLAWGPDAPELPLVDLAEGVPDWLRLVLARSTLARRPMVWGVVSGSDDSALAAVVPMGWTVALRTHADAAGDKYATKWGELLRARGCVLRRQRVVNG